MWVKEYFMKLRHLFFTVITFLALIPFSVSAQDMAYPIEGDGILSFLRRWNRIDTSYVQEFKNLNYDRLNAQGGLELGTVYLIPPLHPGDVYPPAGPKYQPTDPKIFGEKYREYDIESDYLKDACFYIVSGHGGPDPGAITRVNGRELHEDEYNYDFSLRLARNLMKQGATVYVIIQDAYDGIRDERILNSNQSETCLGEPIPKSQIDRLRQRVDKVNQLYERDKQLFNYVRAIELHIDSRNPKEQIDLFFYYANDPQSRYTSYTLRNEIMEQYKKHQPGRGFIGNVSHRDLYVLRHFAPPSVMLEVGNFQNLRDRERILNPNNRQAIANWLTKAFMKDYERVMREL